MRCLSKIGAKHCSFIRFDLSEKYSHSEFGNMMRWVLLGSSLIFMVCLAHVTFTNLKCFFLDPNFGEFKVCHIKAVNRSHKYISIYAALFQLPIANVTVKLKTMRHSNGYKAFFGESTIDACRFLKNPRHPIFLMYYNTFKRNSNINHTCPFDHDIIIDKFYTGNHETEFMRYIPIPKGDYAIHLTFVVRKVETAKIQVFLTIT